MKKLGFILLGLTFLSTLQANQDAVDILSSDRFLISEIRPQDKLESFIKDSSIPIFWFVQALTPSLQLNHLASINIVKRYAQAGHPIIVIIDSESAGLDPNKTYIKSYNIPKDLALRNADSIKKQIKKILGDSTEVIISNDLDINFTLSDLIGYLRNINIQEQLQDLKDKKDITALDIVFPIFEASYLEKIAKNMNLNRIIFIGEKNQKDNFLYIQNIAQNKNIDSLFILHHTIEDLINEKVSSLNIDTSVSLSDMKSINDFVDNLSDKEVAALWGFYSVSPRPSNPSDAKEEFREILLKSSSESNN